MKVLIAEDDPNILEGLKEVLQQEGYTVTGAANGEEALQLYHETQPQILCLDIMMPGINGYDLCKTIRKEDPQVPILFISAKSEEIDRVLGLELGADDFIVKPFGVREVIARIRAVTRRLTHTQENNHTPTCFTMHDLTISPAELCARRDGQCIDLSLRDTTILQTLWEHKGQALTRDTLFNTCWGLDYMPNSRTLDQHISQLRKRIEHDPKHPQIIQTVQGVGYRYPGDSTDNNP